MLCVEYASVAELYKTRTGAVKTALRVRLPRPDRQRDTFLSPRIRELQQAGVA